MRVAIYARYSTDRQSAASAEDQVRLCRELAGREGWQVGGVFADEALSGATRDRPALNQLLLRAGEFDLVLAESIDRLSRDQEDIAAIHKRLRFAGAGIWTIADGAVGEIHIGLKGTMAALFLADLGQKTRRGQIGRVAAGRIPGGLSYGYRKVGALDARGEPERGLRAIDEAEAAVVRRIFEDYGLRDIPTLAIAKALNAERIPSPAGGEWRQNTIVGHRQRGNGILCNALYAGRIAYNRQRMVRDPVTRKRVSRPNPPEQWVVKDVPELRIVEQDLFDRVQSKLAANAGRPKSAQRRPARLFSGLLRCGECGGPMTIVATDRWGCAARKEKGSCGNGRTILNAPLERRLLGALREQMLAPDIVQAYVAEYHRQRAGKGAQARNGRRALQSRLARLDALLGRLAAAYADGGIELDELKARASGASAERDTLRARLAAQAEEEKVVEIDPETAARRYRAAIAALAAELEKPGGPARDKAKAGLRALIDVVVVHPSQAASGFGAATSGRGVELELRGRLAELLTLAQTQKKPAPRREPADCMEAMVAGAGFEPATFRL